MEVNSSSGDTSPLFRRYWILYHRHGWTRFIWSMTLECRRPFQTNLRLMLGLFPRFHHLIVSYRHQVLS